MTSHALRYRLKIETADVHERLHDQSDFAAIAGGTILERDFKRVMARIGGFYAVFDPKMERGSQSAGPNVYAYQARGPLFAHVETSDLDLPDVDTLPALAGAAYVMDGAVLGGQILRRAISDRLTHPYWDWCAEKGAAVWRDARALIDLADTDSEAADHAIDVAKAVFRAFERQVDMTCEDPLA